jgi:hypothetical protein
MEDLLLLAVSDDGSLKKDAHIHTVAVFQNKNIYIPFFISHDLQFAIVDCTSCFVP